MLSTFMYYISLKRSFYNASASLWCINIHAEIAEKLQIKDCGFIFIDAPVYMSDLYSYFLFKDGCSVDILFCTTDLFLDLLTSLYFRFFRDNE